MDGGYIILVTIVYSILFIAHQRTEKPRRRVTQLVILLVSIALAYNANLKSLDSETITGLILGLIISLLFWLLIGRYNPVGTSDNIKVYGMDD